MTYTQDSPTAVPYEYAQSYLTEDNAYCYGVSRMASRGRCENSMNIHLRFTLNLKLTTSSCCNVPQSAMMIFWDLLPIIISPLRAGKLFYSRLANMLL